MKWRFGISNRGLSCLTLKLRFESVEEGSSSAQKRFFKDTPFLFLMHYTYVPSKQGRRQGGGHSRAVPPPNELLCPPTFHPLHSLLNVIDFESETDKTVHIRTRLHALASVSNCTRSQIARLPPPLTHTHTHTTWFVPP